MKEVERYEGSKESKKEKVKLKGSSRQKLDYKKKLLYDGSGVEIWKEVKKKLEVRKLKGSKGSKDLKRKTFEAVILWIQLRLKAKDKCTHFFIPDEWKGRHQKKRKKHQQLENAWEDNTLKTKISKQDKANARGSKLTYAHLCSFHRQNVHMLFQVLVYCGGAKRWKTSVTSG